MTNINKIRSLNKRQVQAAMSDGGSLSGALKLLGVLPNDPRIRNTFIGLLEKYNITRNYDYLNNRMTFTQDELTEAVKSSLCITDVLTKLGFKNHGANYKTIKRWIVSWNINTDHFDKRASSSKNKRVYLREEIFCTNSTYSRSSLGLAARRHKIFDEEKCSR